MVESTPAAEFDEQFGALLHGTLEMFNDVVKDEGMVESDIDKVYRAEEQVKLLWKRSKETVDQARDDLRGESSIARRVARFPSASATDALLPYTHPTAISREYHQHELSSRRSANIPSAEEHDAQMAAERAFIVSRLKSNRGLEQSVTQLQAELEELQRERKEEEADAVEVSELNSEV